MRKQEYKNIACINKMCDEYKENFYSIVEGYRNKLSNRVVLDESVYTMHDFDHHCFDIYKILSSILLEQDNLYIHPYGLHPRELYILNLSVLFHDIGMNVISADRNKHSILSAEYIQNEYDKTGSVFSQNCDLSSNEIKALKAIVIAHSDVKDGSVPKEKNGLNSPDLVDYQMNCGEEASVRTKLLAALLRIADELDVTSNRLGKRELETEIKEFVDKHNLCTQGGSCLQTREYNSYLESLKHWKRLYYISQIKKIDKDIILCIDDDEITKSLNASQEVQPIAQELVSLLIPIRDKINDANAKVFNNSSFSKFVSVGNVIFHTSNIDLQKEINDVLGFRKLEIPKLSTKHTLESLPNKNQFDSYISSEQNDKEAPISSQFPPTIDSKIEEMLSQETRNRKLITFGHFRLNEKYCARDWLDTRELVETKKILNKIVNIFVKELNSLNEEFIVVGVDLVGALVASRVAFALQNPMTYLVSEKNKAYNSDSEIEISTLLKNKVVVLITDVIVSYETIEQIIDQHEIDKKKLLILSLFYRPNDIFMAKADYLRITKSLNNEFKIELFDKEKCIYSSNGCMAANRRINHA